MSSIIFAIIGCALLYVNTSYFIENQKWKYSSGKHIGDWVSISTEENATYRIVFCLGKKLIIEDLKTKEKGYYVNINKG